MNKLMSLMLAGVFALTLGGTASAANSPGSLQVFDEGKVFTSGGIEKAREAMASKSFDHGLKMTVDTHPRMPADVKERFDKASGPAKRDVVRDWARSHAKGDKAEGIYVLICMSPGFTEVLDDRETKNRGFTKENLDHLFSIFDGSLKSSAKLPADQRATVRDKALLEAVQYVTSDLAGTKVIGDKTRSSETREGGRGFMSGIGGWLCIGLLVMLGIWLVIGVFRALTGGGGGGGYGPGGGYGGGGGGGGFFSSMLGGLFGAAAGMYLYNNLFGGGSMFGSSPDAYANDGSGGDTGAGDYSDGDSAGGGGDYGGGDYGDTGGDYGGDYGGGDYGGGGDFGGGDFGGGGDF